MGDQDLRDLAVDLRRHLEWQRADGTQLLLTDAAPKPAPKPPAPKPVAPAAAPPQAVARGKARTIFELPRVTPVPDAERQTLEQVREELGDCTRCKLCNGRTNLVFGV